MHTYIHMHICIYAYTYIIRSGGAAGPRGAKGSPGALTQGLLAKGRRGWDWPASSRTLGAQGCRSIACPSTAMGDETDGDGRVLDTESARVPKPGGSKVPPGSNGPRAVAAASRCSLIYVMMANTCPGWDYFQGGEFLPRSACLFGHTQPRRIASQRLKRFASLTYAGARLSATMTNA